VFDEFDVGLDVEMTLEAWDHIEEIDGLDVIGGLELAPGVVDGTGGLEMAAAGGDGGDENTPWGLRSWRRQAWVRRQRFFGIRG
jgi:hypothetical protein